jgi:predicted Rossmann fold flavoprotein
VVLVEKGPELAGWAGQAFTRDIPLGSSGTQELFDPRLYPRAAAAAGRILAKWSGAASREWLESSGVVLAGEADGLFIAPQPKPFQEQLRALLEAAGVEIRLNHAIESIARQPGGGFRVWSREGEALSAGRLLLATGGERNHGQKLARELGAGTEAPFAAFLRLRLTDSSKLVQAGAFARCARLRCIRTGGEATGTVQLTSRGLEGPAVSNLSASLCQAWKEMDYRFRLEVDWLPETAGAAVRNELDARCRRGTRRKIGDEPLFGFNDRQWSSFLESARVDPALPWPRLKARKLQALVQRLKGDQLSVEGMGLPRGERAWAGGIGVDSIDIETGESLASPGVYFAGEILDMLGLPDGPHLNLGWATGYIAGSAMALA